MKANEAAASHSGSQIIVTRVYDAPRERVFRAWTDPDEVVRWWGPDGFTTTTFSMDVRPGGAWRYVMHGPDGRDYHNKIVYLEVVRPERLVYKHLGEEGCEPVNFQSTVTFDTEGNRTKVTLRMIFESAEACDQVVKNYGAVEGGKQTFSRLADYLSRAGEAGSGTPNPSRCEIRLTRLLDAPRQVVFQAWTDPRHIEKWWGPKNFTNVVDRWDARPNGKIRLQMRAPSGFSHPMTGIFHQVVPTERLVFTAVAEDAAGSRLLESLTTVTFADEGKKTRLTVHASAVGSAPIAAQMLQGMEQGWSQSLDRFEELVASETNEASAR